MTVNNRFLIANDKLINTQNIQIIEVNSPLLVNINKLLSFEAKKENKIVKFIEYLGDNSKELMKAFHDNGKISEKVKDSISELTIDLSSIGELLFLILTEYKRIKYSLSINQNIYIGQFIFQNDSIISFEDLIDRAKLNKLKTLIVRDYVSKNTTDL